MKGKTMKKYDEIIKDNRLFNVTKTIYGTGAMVHLPDCGTCTVVWGENEAGWEHVSVAPKKQFNIPSWDDMCIVKDVFFHDEEEAYQIHPKKSQYVNLKSNCLHIWKPKGHQLGELIEK